MISSYTLYFLIFCTSVVLASSSRKAQQNEKCSKIMCPLTEATICVKVKEPNTKRSYVMMSKCELKHVKCYGDVKTTVVTKKYCNGRALRQLVSKEDEPVQDYKETEAPGEKDRVGNKDPVNDANPLGTSADDIVSQEHLKQENKEENQNPVNSVEEHEPNEESQEEGTGSNPDPPRIQQAENPAVQGDQVTEPDLIEIKPENGEKKDDDDYKQNTLHSNEGDEAGLSCPDACPVRGAMVCARCSHGVYRTFMSSCYMRMYQCKHPKEKLELVSRRACAASGPYLGEMPRPKSVEPFVGDSVLNYIFNLRNSPTGS